MKLNIFYGVLGCATISLLASEQQPWINWAGNQEFSPIYFAKPHWGKISFLDHKKAVQIYGSKLAKFIAAKKKLDPDNLFSNDFVNRICNFKE